MVEPVLRFTNDESAKRLCNYLKYFLCNDCLNDIKMYNAFSFQYDTKQGQITIWHYDSNNQVVKINILTVDSEVDRRKLWQYFYQPEHRSDWE